MSETKFCKDCKHFAPASGECRHKSAVKSDVVYGDNGFYSAKIQRDDYSRSDCGPLGKYWTSLVEAEAKPAKKGVWQRVLDFFLADTRSTGVK